jgi:hypothetical protein
MRKIYYQGARHPLPDWDRHVQRNNMAACVHEASHAICALALCDGISEIRGHGGFAHFRLRNEKQYAPIHVGTVLAAGVIGERKAGFTEFPTPDKLDNDHIFRLGVSITDCQRRAKAIIQANWNLIKMLAAKLLDVRVMSGDEVDNFVRANGGVVRPQNTESDPNALVDQSDALKAKQKQKQKKLSKDTQSLVDNYDPDDDDEDDEDEDDDDTDAKVVKTTTVSNGSGRNFGKVQHLSNGLFRAVKPNGRSKGIYRSSGAASRAL